VSRRGLIVGAALVVIVAAGAGALILSNDDSQPAATPTPAASSARHYLIHLDQGLAQFGSANVEASGVLRITTGTKGAVDAVSIGVQPVDTGKGPSGPLGLALGQGDAQVTSTGTSVSATFPVEFVYPLLYTAAGETLTADVVTAQRKHTGTATFDGRIVQGSWSVTLSLAPAPLEGTDFNLPQGKIDIQSPAVFETDEQFLRNSGGTRIWCVELQPPPKGSFTADEVSAALREAQQAWTTFGGALLTKDQIEQLNANIASAQPGSSEAKEPARVPIGKCYTLAFAVKQDKGGGMTADAARRTITIGRNALTRCKASTLGKLMSHGLAHIAFRLDADEPSTAAQDNLMRDCPSGTALDETQRRNQWSFAAEIARELTLPGRGIRENVAFGELERLLGQLAAGSPSPSLSPSPSGSPRVTRRPTATPHRTASPTPSHTPSPTPTHTPSPTPAPTESPTAEPTASP
jgi:hypothetical protein